MFSEEQLQRARSTLTSLGYLDRAEDAEEPPAVTESVASPGFLEALGKFRKTYRKSLQLDPSAEGLDGRTMAALTKPHCGWPDPVGEGGRARRLARSFLARAKALGGTLKYFHVPSGSGDDQSRFEAIERAFGDWANHALAVQVTVRFEKADSREEADILVEWIVPGTPGALDLTGDDVVASATFPDNGTRPLLIHLDSTVTWVDTANGGIHIESVVLHEIGHLLGLSHDEDDDRSVMFYSFDKPKPDLKARDKEAFCRRYPCKPPPP